MVGLAALHRRYLRLLGVGGTPVGLDGLRALVDAHIRRVPFENVSKRLLVQREGRGRVTTLEEFLDGIEHHDLGGTCYTSNPFLADLRAALGYEASLVGADMSAPNVHTSVRVAIDGALYHVDVGYAAPLREPIPLHRLPHAVRWGDGRYVLEAAPNGHVMSPIVNGERRHGYFVHPPPRSSGFFCPIVLRSFEPGRTFMRCLRITRYFHDHAIELRNQRLLRITADDASATSVASLTELRRAVNEQLRMPRCPIEEAVRVLERVNGREFFGGQQWNDSTD
jgi:arylamine N-acetyltransferase